MSDQPGPMIHRQMIAVMRDIEPIRKNRDAFFGKFRGIDDVYQHVGPILAQHGVYPVPKVLRESYVERVDKEGRPVQLATITMRFEFTAEDGSHVDAEYPGVGIDHSDKAANKAVSVALREACIKTFCIPFTDGSVDPETANIPLAPKSATPPAPTVRPAKRDLGGGRFSVMAVPLFVTKKPTKKPGSFRYGCKIAENPDWWLNTFDGNQGQRLDAAKAAGERLMIEYTSGQYGDDIVAIDAAPSDLPSTPPPQPAAETLSITTDVTDVEMALDGQRRQYFTVNTPLGAFITRDANLAAELRQRAGKAVTMMYQEIGDRRKIVGFTVKLMDEPTVQATQPADNSGWIAPL